MTDAVGSGDIIEFEARAMLEASWEEERERDPLHDAARRGRVDLLRQQIARGVDVDCLDKWGDETPLFEASCRGHTACVEALIAAGADVHRSESNGITPLRAAAQSGHVACVQALVAAGPY